jgi:hypothetical protein
VSRPWGFQIADLAVHITGEGPRFHPAGFPPTAPPVLTLIAAPHTSDAPLRPDGEPSAEQDSWAAFYRGPTDDDDSQVTLLSKSGYVSPPETIRIDFGEHATTGTLRYRADVNPALVTFPLDQLLLIHLLSSREGMVVHGAAITNDRHGVLLIGQSGAGKTTTARAAADRGLGVLSDERTVIRRVDGAFCMAGTPWYGDGAFYDPRVLPVAAICVITQSDRDALEPITPARMLAELYRCHFPPLWSEAATAATLATAEAFISSVPLYRLHNTRGGGAVDLVRSILDGLDA